MAYSKTIRINKKIFVVSKINFLEYIDDSECEEHLLFVHLDAMNNDDAPTLYFDSREELFNAIKKIEKRINEQ